MSCSLNFITKPGVKSVPPEIVVWNYDTFDNIFVIENDIQKYLKESCW